MPGPMFISIKLYLSSGEEAFTCEFTHQAFAGGQPGDNTPASDALKNVFTVPGDEMTVINDIFLVFIKLLLS